MQWPIERFILEREDLQQDIKGVDLRLDECRIGDFACGWGYTSLGLMLELKCHECIGVDRFEKNPDLDVPSLEDVNNQLKEIRDMALTNPSPLQHNKVIAEISNLFINEHIPNFQIGDIITGDNLPSDLDFVYCKKFLRNVFDGGYSNSRHGEEGVRLAVKNIANAVKQGGQVCLVEPAGTNFMTYLEQAGLQRVRVCRIHRNEIIGQKRSKLLPAQCLIYHYSKF
jgi:hypothetical protein